MNKQDILLCLEKVKFTQHAVKEMADEEFGEVLRIEVLEALEQGEIIETYQEDWPIASCLIYGRTKKDRPLHVVCAPVKEEKILVIITVYEPDPKKWIDFRRRTK